MLFVGLGLSGAVFSANIDFLAWEFEGIKFDTKAEQ